MVDAELIERIIREVLAEMGSSQASPCRGPGFYIVSKKENTDVEALKARLPQNCRLFFMENRALAMEFPWEELEGIILPELTINCMVDLAQGKGSGLAGKQVLELLLSGRRVEVLEFEYLKYRNSGSAALWQLYESHRKVLESFGLAKRLEQGISTEIFRKNLLTDQEIKRLNGDGINCLNIDRRTLVTDLARESARAFGMTIQYL